VPSLAVAGACARAFADVPVADAPAVPAVAVLVGVVGFAAVAPGVATAAVNSTSTSAVGLAGVPGCFAVVAAVVVAVPWPAVFAAALRRPAPPGEGVAVSAAVVDELLAIAAAAIASGSVEFVEPVAVLLVTPCWRAGEIAAAGGMPVVTCAAVGCVESATPAPEAALSVDLVFPGFDVVGFVPPCKFAAAVPSPVPVAPGGVSATGWLVPSTDGLSGALDGA
jgi:hypothetical protein